MFLNKSKVEKLTESSIQNNVCDIPISIVDKTYISTNHVFSQSQNLTKYKVVSIKEIICF